MTQHLDHTENETSCLVIQEMLGVSFPEQYKELLATRNQGSYCADLSLSWELDSVLGATEFLRAARPDLHPQYVVLRFEGDRAICLDLSQDRNGETAPVVAIDLDSDKPPAPCHDSLRDFLEAASPAVLPESEDDTDEWFQKGLTKLDEHMGKLSFEYKHDKGGQLPRSHLWRPYRFCVQDIILGITVIRHNRTLNCLDVDVFLTASIAEYAPESGCRALALILLADAYKSGGSMEIRFMKDVEGGKIPHEFVNMAGNFGVPLSRIDQGRIMPSEAKRLFLSLSGFSVAVSETISALENAGRVSAASVCYAMHHGVWTAEEIEMILALSQMPETILANGPGPEVWHVFHHDLVIGRTAMFGSYLDRHLLRREHQPSTDNAEGAVIELEDDERLVSIGFDPAYCAKIYRIDETEADLPLPWQEGQASAPMKGGTVLHVLLRAREVVELRQYLRRDIKQAMELHAIFPEDSVGIMVPADYHRLEAEEREKFREMAGKIFILVCPEFVNQLDLGVWKRLEAVKVMRK